MHSVKAYRASINLAVTRQSIWQGIRRRYAAALAPTSRTPGATRIDLEELYDSAAMRNFAGIDLEVD